MCRRLVCLTAVALSGCVLQPEGDTPPPQVFFAGKDAAEVAGVLAESCASAGNTIVSQTPNTIVCEKQLAGADGIDAKYAIGNRYSTTPVAQISLVMAPGDGGTKVFWSFALQTQMAGGQMRRQAIRNATADAEIREKLTQSGAQ